MIRDPLLGLVERGPNILDLDVEGDVTVVTDPGPTSDAAADSRAMALGVLLTPARVRRRDGVALPFGPIGSLNSHPKSSE